MKGLMYLEKLINESKAFLKKYEDALAADPNDFGAKLMVGNLRRHTEDIENQATALRASKSHGPAIQKESMAASSAC